MITFNFGEARLEYDPDTGHTMTWFPKGRWTGGLPSEDDEYHGKRLGITGKQHHGIHEYLHHLIGVEYFKFPYSQILYNSAHGIPIQGEDVDTEEWLITNLTYFLRLKPQYDQKFISVLEERGVNMTKLIFTAFKAFDEMGIKV